MQSMTLPMPAKLRFASSAVPSHAILPPLMATASTGARDSSIVMTLALVIIRSGGNSADAIIYSTPRANRKRPVYRNTDFDVGSIRLTAIFSRATMSGIFGDISFLQVSDW